MQDLQLNRMDSFMNVGLEVRVEDMLFDVEAFDCKL